MKFLRAPLFSIVILLSAFAQADRLILLPVGKKIPFRALKLTHMFDGADNDRSFSTLGLGIGTSWEIEVSFDQEFFGPEGEIFDFSYNLSDPVINIAPGISVGVRDALDRSPQGTWGYAAFTYQRGLTGELNQDSPAEGTVGLKFSRDDFDFFLGAMVPYSTQLAILAEMDSSGYFIGGLEYRPTPGAEVRWLHQAGRSSWSVGYLLRF